MTPGAHSAASLQMIFHKMYNAVMVFVLHAVEHCWDQRNLKWIPMVTVLMSLPLKIQSQWNSTFGFLSQVSSQWCYEVSLDQKEDWKDVWSIQKI